MSGNTKKGKKTYIAITIGPIIRTFGLAATPSALWASSYLFSFIARRLRDGLMNDLPDGAKVEEKDFISPYPVYKGENVLSEHTDDGLGLLHDHMIFVKPKGFTWEIFRNLRDSVIQEACKRFTLDLTSQGDVQETDLPLMKKNLAFLKKYVMIYAVEFQAKNPIMESSKMLDCMELATPFVANEKENPILSFFTNENQEERRNEEIKSRGQEQLGTGKEQKTINPEKWQLLYRNKYDDGYSVKNLPTIASGGFSDSKMKKHVYYAIVRSDGDNMGKLISQLQSEDDFHIFSGTCLAYCAAVAKTVEEYKGMTVYAGGDDLLAILPCEAIVEKEIEVEGTNGKEKKKIVEQKTVFDFVREANAVFAQYFLTNESRESPKTIKDIFDKINTEKSEQNKLPPPSLTWGITLCHRKYPLYEALEDSTSLLFGAKGKDYKNALNLRLIKHSGQTSAIYVKNDLLADENGTFFALLNDILGRSEKETQDNNEILLSCLHTFHEAKGVFQLANAENAEHLFQNMFDADAHIGNDFLHKSLPRLYVDHCLKADIYALDDEGNKVVLGETKEERKKEIPDAPEALHYLLRIMKFFVEKAGERE